jgi:raffinose/stachyose/melibiose transport system permease protein
MSQVENIPLKIAHEVRRFTRVRKRLLSEPQITAMLFMLPALLIFLIFVIWPIIQSARYSVYRWNGLGPLVNNVGMDNYSQILSLEIKTLDSDTQTGDEVLSPGFSEWFRVRNIVVGATDPVFWKALTNNLVLVAWSLITQVPLAVFLAILVSGKIKGSSLFRTLFFVPFVLSDVLVGVLWQWIYNPSIGLANGFLSGIGLPRQGWLGDPNLALLCILIVATWKYLGFHIVIYIAAVQGISEELYEAARIDGANGWALHRHITIPLLIPTIRIDSVLIIIGSLKAFDLFWILTGGGGGPAHSAELVGTYMFFTAFRKTLWGYGSALAFTLFTIAFLFALIFLYMTYKSARAVKG